MFLINFQFDVLSASDEEVAVAISSKKFDVKDFTSHVLVYGIFSLQEECEAIINHILR